jgi:3-(methylthio)propanoyl-CoA dehydrogenase
MAEYVAPLKDMQFVLKHVVGLDQVNTLPGWEEVTDDLVDALLEEAAKMATEVLSPLNYSGDRQGAQFKDGVVKMPAGFREAYKQYTDAGWNRILGPTDFGGQGLPHVVATPIEEMWGAANLAFKLCPMLTQGAIEALHLVGSEKLQKTYLAKMVSGEWTGTMNLTEPQAGSDLSLVRTKATPQPTEATVSRARRSSSPTASTTTPRTSSTWCWAASRARPKACAASRSSSCRSSS